MLKRIIKHPLTYVLIFSAIIRLAMIKYGLPFWLYNDEPPFVLAALKMMQLKTLLPVLHEEAFKPFLYYPPFISYLFLPFFALAIAFKYITFSGSLSQLLTVLATDTTIFFITARVIMIIISLLTILLVYKISLSLIKDKWSSIFTSLIMSTSIMNITLSITGKHWAPILFIFTLGLYILTRQDWSIKRRFYLSAIIVGLGTGVSTITILFSFIMIFWYVYYEKKGLLNMFKDPMMYKVGLIIILLSIIPILLYPASLGFVPDMTLHDLDKTFLGLITSPFVFLFPFIKTEPVMVSLFIIGTLFSLNKSINRKFFILTIVFSIIYSIIFYIFFRFEYRFLLPITLLLSIGAGFGIYEIKNRLNVIHVRIIISILLIICIALSVRISSIGNRNDSRVLAKKWLENNTKSSDKIIVYANQMRLPNTRSGILEQEFIDPTSLRTNDKNEKEIDSKLLDYRVFNALNLYTVRNDNFYNQISNYVKKNKYNYIVIAKKDFLNNPEQFIKMRKLTENATLVAQYGNSERGYSLAKTEIGPDLLPLFKISEFGPEVEVYRLNNK